ncbi:MAG: hypothetical protein ACK56I_12205, partial [bacterium]
RLHGDACHGRQRTGQAEQVHAAALGGIKQLQVLQPGGHREVGQRAAAPAQFPHTPQQGGVAAQIGGLVALQRLDQAARIRPGGAGIAQAGQQRTSFVHPPPASRGSNSFASRP